MQKIKTRLPEIKLVGLTVRTNNRTELEFNSPNAKIFPCVQRYFQQQLAEKIPHRIHPGTTICAYTEYESDYTGDYTYFIGEQVSQFEDSLEGFETHIIPSQTYAKFTTGPAPMPNVLREAWEEIWQMKAENLGGKRRYHTDFEVYDERAADHQKIVMDILIGIEG
jgi:predicted transcriptional regulator YdeE